MAIHSHTDIIFHGCHTAEVPSASSERYEFDIHTHTIASGHGSAATITDMAKAAAARNLKMLGISDHGPATLGGGRVSISAISHTRRRSVWVCAFFTGQKPISSTGRDNLDLDDSVLAHLDYVIARHA